MKDLSDKEKFEYIQHWENQAGSILRLSITILGVMISATSIFITLIATSNEPVLTSDLISRHFDPLVARLTGLPVIGEPTAAVLVFVLITATLVLAGSALLAIFVYAPYRSLRVMAAPEETNENGNWLDETFQKKGSGWDQTVTVFEFGLMSLLAALFLAIPVFVVRDARYALATFLLLSVATVLLLKQNVSEVLYYLSGFQYRDALSPIGGFLCIGLFLGITPNPDLIEGLIIVFPLIIPSSYGIWKALKYEKTEVYRQFIRDGLISVVFGILALPALLVTLDIFNELVGVLIFFVMVITSVGFLASMFGITIGIIVTQSIKYVNEARRRKPA